VPLETIQSFTDRQASTDDKEEQDDNFEAEREMSFGHFSSFLGGSGSYS
jgi:hypothetical protein